MVKITFYDSWEDMMRAEEQARKAADVRVKPPQASIQPGQYFINFRHGPLLPVFGEILDIETLCQDEEDQAYITRSYAQPHMRFYRPTRCYSAACPAGETGDVHLSEVAAIIDPELFEYYRGNGWRKPIS